LLRDPGNNRLKELVTALDPLGLRRTLIDRADALPNAKLTSADVPDFVRTADHAYHRALVGMRRRPSGRPAR
jgi:hypothetical protein